MTAIVVTKFQWALLISLYTLQQKKLFLSTHSDCIQFSIFRLKASTSREWRWSDDWVTTRTERIENVSSSWRNYFPNQFWCVFLVHFSHLFLSVHSPVFDRGSVELGTNWMIEFWRCSHARLFEAWTGKVKKTESFHQNPDLLWTFPRTLMLGSYRNGVRSSSISVRQPSRTRNNFFRSKKLHSKAINFRFVVINSCSRKHKIIDLQRCPFPSFRSCHCENRKQNTSFWGRGNQQCSLLRSKIIVIFVIARIIRREPAIWRQSMTPTRR